MTNNSTAGRLPSGGQNAAAVNRRGESHDAGKSHDTPAGHLRGGGHDAAAEPLRGGGHDAAAERHHGGGHDAPAEPDRYDGRAAASHLRHGSCLEHGHAHEKDHRLWSRRDFLARLGLATAGVTFALGGQTMSAYGRGIHPHSLHAMESDRILVLIQLNGGNDGLNTVVPIENEIYYQRRPTIAIPKQSALRLDDQTGLHPAMGNLESLWGDGRMAVVHNVGYENQTRSHFRGTDVWVTGSDVDEYVGTGWAGRYLADDFEDYLTDPPPYPLAVRLGSASPALFQSRFGNVGMTFADTRQFQSFVAQGGYYDAADVPSTVYGGELAYAREVTNASFRYVEAVQNAAGEAENLAEYPGGLGQSLGVVARMIRGRLGSRIYTVAHGGFDTHSMQGGAQGSHAARLGNLADSVAAFYADLAADGLDRHVMIMTFSEFGRTLSENGSQGTDHGAGAPMLLFGSGLRGGLYGTPSDLQDLYGGDPRFTTDYRSVYSTVLSEWFGLQTPEVQTLLDGSYAPLGFVGDRAVGAEREAALPNGFVLEQNYPNPFNPITRITFRLDRPARARLQVFDARGRLIRTLANGAHPAGSHDVSFAAGTLPSGTYFYRLDTAHGSRTRKMILIQ